MLVRAAGPSLVPFGISKYLADPKLTLISGGATLTSNENWQAVDAATRSGVGEFCNTVGPVLGLQSVTAGYAGEYVCVASNPFGSTRSARAVLSLAPTKSAVPVPLAAAVTAR